MAVITPSLTSPKPYLIRAWHEWMTDNGLTPHILVMVDATVTVPREYVKNNEVVLNVGHEATGGLNLGNEEIRFQARFAGRVREIVVPIDRVASIFARENGQGMVFEALLTEDIDSRGNDPADDMSPSVQAERTASQPHGLTLVNKASTSTSTSRKTPTRQSAVEPSDDEPQPTPPTPKGGDLKVVK